MSLDLVYSSQARADIKEIALYIARDNLPAANRFFAEIESTCELISRNPYIGQACDSLRPGWRQFSFSHYVILFRAESETLRILRVFHGSRDWEKII